MIAFQCFSRLPASRLGFSSSIDLLTIITISWSGRRCLFLRKLSRNILFKWFLWTAFGICFFAIANPNLGDRLRCLPINIVMLASPWRKLFSKTCRKSVARDNLFCLENDSPARSCTCYGVRRALPLARRALMTLLPPRVCMRARKPCVLARFKLLGWNVRFMSMTSD